MLQGLDGKAILYDGENRPTQVTFNGVVTSYDYGPGGAGIKKTNGADQTVYLGTSEIRNFGQVASEAIVRYPHDDVRAIDGVESWLHRDQLSSVRLITDDTGSQARRTSYTPFGEPTDAVYGLASMPEESKGFIGEYYDDEAGLSYLNARYYDPSLGRFIQPDW